MRALLKQLQARFDVSDEVYVENCRRGLTQLDRIRWFMWVFVVVAIVALGWGCSLIFQNLANPLMPGMNSGFVVGVLLGISIGFSFGLIIHNVAHQILSLLSSMRSERLMVRYHDELQHLYQEWETAEPALEADPADESASV